MKEEEFRKMLAETLSDYHHYKFMSGGILSMFSWFAGMNLGDFMEWLKSQK